MATRASFRFFKCPSCAALYQIVKAEAKPEPEAGESQLPHDLLSWPRGDHARTPQRSAPARSPGCIERYLGARGANDPAGCGDNLCNRQRPQEKSSRSGDLRQQIYSRVVDGRILSAIQITTAAAICTVLDLLATGQLPQSGFIRQEDISLKIFLENRFGQVYAKPETSVPHQRFGGSVR